MAEEDGETDVRKVLESCAMIQSMIDISTENLVGLRTQCVTSAELTQQEIRTFESKLIKLFSRQLQAKDRLRSSEQQPPELQHYPRLKQWLLVVGLGEASVQSICAKVGSLEDMLKMSDHDVRSIILDGAGRDEEERRLVNALRNLRKYTEYVRRDDGQEVASNMDLHWDSWDQALTNSSGGGGTSPRPLRQRSARPSVSSAEDAVRSNPSSPPVISSVPVPPWSPTATNATASSSSVFGNYIVPPVSHPARDRKYTPPPTPPTSTKKGEKIKFPTTPPPKKRHQTAATNLLPDSYPLTKSKSHESQLGNRIDVSDNSSARHEPHPRRPRLFTEPGLESDQDDLAVFASHNYSSSLTNSPMRMSPSPYSDGHGPTEELNHRPSGIGVPTSPRTTTIPPHILPTNVLHRFHAVFKVTNCDHCKKPMFMQLKCKGCKLRVHRDCADKLPQFCDLSKLSEGGSHSPMVSRMGNKKDKEHRRAGGGGQPLINVPLGTYHSETCSNTSSSSCNSSAPSSPAPNNVLQTPPIQNAVRHFDFGADNSSDKDINLQDTRPLSEMSEMVETQKSNDSDKTMSGTSGSTDSEKTLAGRVDSQDSQVSDVDSDRPWPRQNSLSIREWEIPYSELVFGEKVGTGRFGTVCKGHWHGEVAIKVFSMDQMDDENILEAFKQEVAMFRKTRHENLVLFMCACVKPPHLAIVTRLCKGMTLYMHIHICRDRFNLNRAIIIALQISQGMGYLHSRGIIHKDLKTKNIFLENGKVVITDFGLLNITRLCRGNRKGDWLTVPAGWLCYLAPEITCCLRASNDFHANDTIPFSKASDVYAFGTVWYELLCGEWPFKGQPPEAIIWQVGKGVKQSLANIQASRDVKDILMFCWSYKQADRPEFSHICRLLEKLPKKRLARSPSHPIQLSRSAESVF